MKCNLNKILLEAINRGIQLALDDFDDNNLIGQQTQTIKDKNITKDYINYTNNFVDLGLPSGTIWAKYNLGANYDILINHPEDAKPKDWCGDYYAWGETEQKTNANYKYIEKITTHFGPSHRYTKYNMTDKLTTLELCDDPAYNNNPYKEKLGIDICLPSLDQYNELIKYTTKSFLYNDGLLTCILTSKINNQKIIFPLNGYIRATNKATLEKTNPSNGYYMTNYIAPQFADWLNYSFEIESNRLHVDIIARDHGMNVRPVIMK